MRNAIQTVSKTVQDHPWLFGGALFLALAGVATALGAPGKSWESFIKLLDQEGGADAALALVKLVKISPLELEGYDVKSLCADYLSYTKMCELLSHSAVHVMDGMGVKNCAENVMLGQAKNPAIFVCNMAKFAGGLLSKETLAECATMAKTL